MERTRTLRSVGCCMGRAGAGGDGRREGFKEKCVFSGLLIFMRVWEAPGAVRSRDQTKKGIPESKMFPVRVYIELLPAWPKSAGDSGRSGTSMRRAIQPEPLLYLT